MPDLDTSSIVELDRRHLLHPYQGFDTFRTDDVLPITRGSGARLVDNDGREYLDAVGGMWCTNIGLGRDEMADAIAAQVRDLAYANPFVDMTNVPSVQLAARLAELAPGDLNHVFFTCGGSTAIDATFRLVQFYQHALGRPEKRGILSRIDAYHGTTFASVSIGGKPGDRIPGFDYLDDRIHHLSSPNHYRFGAGRSEQEFADDLVAEFEFGDRPDGRARPGGGVLRRTDHGIGWGDRPTGRLPAADLAALSRQRHPVRLRRGRDGVRPARRVVRVGLDVRDPARRDHRGQGPDVGVPAARGVDLQ